MEVLIAILFIIILVLIVQQRKAYAKHTEELREEVEELSWLIKKLEIPKPVETARPVVEPVAEKPKPVPPAIQPYQKPLEESLFVVPGEPEAQPPVVQKVEEVISTPVFKQPPPAQREQAPQPPTKPGFFERNPDLEKFIGENLVSKIGIAILVLAIGFFVKYAIDNDWIGHAGRVAVGVLCGSILIGVAHRLQKNYQAFSSVLVGGGLAIFYFTIALAYHEYQLFSQITTFIIMLVITAFAVVLSFLYNRQELAIISLVGGFATPFMASDGTGSYVSLFIYLIILNAGLLVIAYKKSWRLLNLLAFILTVILFTTWATVMLFDKDKITMYRDGFLFATVFYLLFLAINIAHNIKQNKKFIASDFGILLANTCLYFSAGLYFITKMEATEYRGLFTAVMGVFNMALSYILFRNKKVDTNILYLLVGITLTFVSLTAPIQLKGNHITLFWACEAVLLYWLYQKSSIKLMHITSLAVTVAMLLSLLMDWMNIYGVNKEIPVIANRAFITTIFSAVSCLLISRLYSKSSGDKSKLQALPLRVGYLIAGCLLLYGGGALEVAFQFSVRYASNILGGFYWMLYSMAFIAVFGFVSQKTSLFRGTVYLIVLYAGCLVLYLLHYKNTYDVLQQIQEARLGSRHFIAHWVTAGLFIYILVSLVKLLRAGITGLQNLVIMPWLVCLVAIIFLSFEGSLLSNAVFYNGNNEADIQRIYIKTGLPILWGLSSFVLMWLGMKNKNRSLRIISLVLFGITLLKLFIFDIRNIPVAGKIAAFFSLGVLLLIVSFMYQRLKKIIIEDEKNARQD